MPLIIDEKQIVRLQKSRRKKRKGKSVKPNVTVERDFRRRMTELWIRVLTPTTEKIKKMAAEGASPQAIADVIELALQDAEFQYGMQVDDIVSKWKWGVDTESRRALQKGLSHSLGIDVSALIDDPIVADAIALGSMDASGLIRSIPSDYLTDVARAVADDFVGKPLPEKRTLSQQIAHIGEVSKSRAELIARDQTSKLTGLINQTRQTSIGVSMYIWRTSKDERVVGKPGGLYPKGNKAHGNHYAMDGMYCKWGDPTVYSKDKGKTWLKRKSDMPKNEPGQDIQCRCHAEPVIDIDQIVRYSQPL